MNNIKKRPSLLSQSNGFTLIEVLVAVLVLAIGLLGMASLQLISTQSSSSALTRSQATMLAYDLAERMRQNRTEAISGSYDVIKVDASGDQDNAPASPNCIQIGCNSGQLAQQDVREWLDNITDIAGIGVDGAAWRPSIAGATAVITRNNNEFTLLLSWNEADSAENRDITRSYRMEFDL
ncbi:type IV pilus modification protein PilV [Endozoicomonas numazuensis]|uniref:type IV pilus modification protein PilV n=1 Tax=Endozoicomonas numazuensis TaxID=1137799 RepID=UPI00068F8329|nr:type IV pilus modification protein PilV [Endozoicomonas numazuensis]